MAYPDNQSQSARLYDRALHVLPGGNSRHTVYYPPFPVYAAKGKGARIWDVDGVERIDFINNWSSLFHGHNHPKIVEALKNQTDDLISVGMPTEREIELAERVCDRLPGIEQVRFSNSGTEGVLFAIKAARAYTGRPKIAKIEGAYHGSGDTAGISVAPSPADWGDPDAPVSIAPNGVGPGAAADVIVLPMNKTAAARALIERHADDLAGVIIDPLPSHMGFLRIAPDFLEMLRAETKKRGILLIFDEVYSFRMGYHGAQGVLGVTPDLTALGKVIGGGMPIGAVGGPADLMTDLFDPRSGKPKLGHGGTFNANPMSMAAGSAALDLLDEACFDQVTALGDRLRAGLRDAIKTAGVAGGVTGETSLVALFHTDETITDYRSLVALMGGNPAVMKRAEFFFRHMLANGVYMAAPGLMVLSSAMTDADIDFFLDHALEALRAIANGAAD